MAVDIIRAVNDGLEQAAGLQCPHAKNIRNAMIGGEWRSSMKGLSASQIADATAGAIENVRSNGASVKDAISLALSTQKAATADIPQGIAAKILAAKSAAPKSADRKVPKAQQILEKPAPIRPIEAAKKSDGILSHMHAEQKVAFGISAMLATFGAIGTLDAISKIKKTEADGTSHIQPTQVGLALLNGMLTAAMGYAAHQQFRAR